MKRQWNVDLRLCVLSYTVDDVRRVLYLGLDVSMDSLTLTLASLSQRYLAEAQDDWADENCKWTKMNVFVFIGIGGECLGTFLLRFVWV